MQCGLGSPSFPQLCIMDKLQNYTKTPINKTCVSTSCQERSSHSHDCRKAVAAADQSGMGYKAISRPLEIHRSTMRTIGEWRVGVPANSLQGPINVHGFKKKKTPGDPSQPLKVWLFTCSTMFSGNQTWCHHLVPAVKHDGGDDDDFGIALQDTRREKPAVVETVMSRT